VPAVLPGLLLFKTTCEDLINLRFGFALLKSLQLNPEMSRKQLALSIVNMAVRRARPKLCDVIVDVSHVSLLAVLAMQRLLLAVLAMHLLHHVNAPLPADAPSIFHPKTKKYGGRVAGGSQQEKTNQTSSEAGL
jgi:hypothetical protein